MLYIGIACDHRLQPQVSDNIHHDMLLRWTRTRLELEAGEARGWTLACRCDSDRGRDLTSSKETEGLPQLIITTTTTILINHVWYTQLQRDDLQLWAVSQQQSEPDHSFHFHTHHTIHVVHFGCTALAYSPHWLAARDGARGKRLHRDLGVRPSYRDWILYR